MCVRVPRCLDSVPAQAINYFKESAEALIEKRGAVNALAAALAHISGATSLEQRSLMNSDAVSTHARTHTHTHAQILLVCTARNAILNQY